MSDTARSEPRTVSARKQPRQKRSQAMVGRILEATRDLLVEEGLGALTTNHVAKAADISVGSLYQYFPNKQAIISELFSQWLTEVRDKVNRFGIDVAGQLADQVFEDFFNLIYGAWLESPDDLKFAREMNAAVKLFPELAELDRAHQLAMARALAGVLRAVGSQESDEKLEKIGLYLYGLHNAFEDMIVHSPADADSLYPLHAQVTRLVFEQALSAS